MQDLAAAMQEAGLLNTDVVMPQPPLPCAAGSEVCDERQAKRVAAAAARELSHKKYMPVHQRAESYGNIARRSAAPVHRSFLAMSRASPVALAKMLVGDGLLEDLEGQP
eukprot:1482983-Alexandrium_andersonii.AAC.1